MSKPKLTNKQKAFVDEYIIDLNATQAAIRAGYSEKTANVIAAQILAKLSIQEEIAKAIAERSKRTQVNADWVLKNLQEIFHRCMQNIPVIEKGVNTGVYKFEPAAATRAVELIGKHLGMFVDKVDHSGGLDVVIKHVPHEEGEDKE